MMRRGGLLPPADLARRRLAAQFLMNPTLHSAQQVVARLGAVQAQDYTGAKWALAMRTRGDTDAAVEQALTEGAILRTHLLRPTWHFVTAADIRWLLGLTGPRVDAGNGYRYRQLELDAAVFRRTGAVLIQALRGGRQLTRAELSAALNRGRIDTGIPQRLAYILMRAELDGIICSGARRGKQFTYALLDERVPSGKDFSPDDALRELVMRYFTTRGPATIHDFVWWSGLTGAHARRGLEAAGRALEQETIAGKTYWFADTHVPRTKTPTAQLLPNYDEYFIGFRDRSAILEAIRRAGVRTPNEALTAHVVALNGQLVGGWKRILNPRSATVSLALLAPVSRANHAAITRAVRRYEAFLGTPVRVEQH